jgi:hypothetical protein
VHAPRGSGWHDMSLGAAYLHQWAAERLLQWKSGGGADAGAHTKGQQLQLCVCLLWRVHSLAEL